MLPYRILWRSLRGSSAPHAAHATDVVRLNSLSEGLDPPSEPASSEFVEIWQWLNDHVKFCFVGERKLQELTTASPY